MKQTIHRRNKKESELTIVTFEPSALTRDSSRHKDFFSDQGIHSRNLATKYSDTPRKWNSRN